MDIRMPVMDGLEATRRLGEPGGAAVRVLVLTTFDLDDYVFEALRAGASGFLLKDSPPEDLLAAVHTVASGDALLSPAVTRRVIERFAALPPGRPDLAARIGSSRDGSRRCSASWAAGSPTPRSPRRW